VRTPLVAAVAALALAGAAKPASTPAPALLLADRAPLVVRGVHFRSSERVRLSVAGVRRAAITATAAGTFVARLGQVRDDACTNPLLVVAVGSAGSHAVLKLPQPECPPA